MPSSAADARHDGACNERPNVARLAKVLAQRETARENAFVKTERDDRVVEAAFLASAATPAQLPPLAAPEIAFAGRSNVGKSSLMNCLLGRRSLVFTSSTPGRTRTISFFSARDLDGTELLLVDLPGYGWAKRSKQERSEWAVLAEAYVLGRATLATLVLVVDARRGVESDDLDLLRLGAEPASVPRKRPTSIVVATKLDKLAQSARKPALVAIERAIGRPVFGVSAHTGFGREALWKQLKRAATRSS
jgi:GTP-binding protein